MSNHEDRTGGSDAVPFPSARRPSYPSRMPRRLEPIAHVALLLAAVLACGGGSKEDAPGKKGSAPAEAPEPAEQAASVTASTLVADYKGNEVRGDGKWKGKLVKVAGIVNGITKDFTDSAHVQLGSGGDFEVENVDCEMKPEAVAAAGALSKGNKVVVKGRVSGLILLSVMLKDCEILPVGAAAPASPPPAKAPAPPSKPAPPAPPRKK